MRLDPGTPIDVWCVEKRLGSGGMGAVYRCFNRSAPRIRAALKILDPTLAYDPEIRGRFIREAELLFQLNRQACHLRVEIRTLSWQALGQQILFGKTREILGFRTSSCRN